MSKSVERKAAELRALLEGAEREAEAASARLARVKGDYVAGELNAAEWRELRADLEPEAAAAAAERQRLAAQLAEVKAGPDLAGVESELLEQLERIRAAVVGEVSDAAGVDAVRAALLRLFDRFILHRGVAEHANLELVGEGYWIEPVISERAVAGYDETLHPVLARKPLGKAENNCRQTLAQGSAGLSNGGSAETASNDCAGRQSPEARSSPSETTSRSNGSSAARRRRYGETVTRWVSPQTQGTSIGRVSADGSVSTLSRRSTPADLQPNEITQP